LGSFAQSLAFFSHLYSGLVVCNGCSQKRIKLTPKSEPQRICDKCVKQLEYASVFLSRVCTFSLFECFFCWFSFLFSDRKQEQMQNMTQGMLEAAYSMGNGSVLLFLSVEFFWALNRFFVVLIPSPTIKNKDNLDLQSASNATAILEAKAQAQAKVTTISPTVTTASNSKDVDSDDEAEEKSKSKASSSENSQCRAIYVYASTVEGDLSFNEGDLITVLERNDNGFVACVLFSLLPS
jgi:hypothetical protein